MLLTGVQAIEIEGCCCYEANVRALQEHAGEHGSVPRLNTVSSNARTVVTRNTADFVGTDVNLLNPLVAA